MRTLSGEIDNSNFEPVKKVLLDGKETGITIPVNAVMDLNALHGPDAVQYLITEAINGVDMNYNLTDSEKDYYNKNFRKLVGV